ncbi:MAG: hypothetical protein K1Y36_27610 [Blastocatellia bacterium]|nr:hypothetical protein [Blastocatellia bacterium]
MNRQKLVILLCSLLFILGAASLYPLQKAYDQSLKNAYQGRDRLMDDVMYMSSGETVRRLSLGFDGLVADVYWIRTVQYFGRKFLGEIDAKTPPELKSENIPLLAPLLDIVTTVDPRHMSAYSFGAYFLGEYDLDAAAALLHKGIQFTDRELKNRPNDPKYQRYLWKLYFQLGDTYWRAKKYKEASTAYRSGSVVPTAPPTMILLAGAMEAGNDRSVAYDIFDRNLTEAEDEVSHITAEWRLRHLASLDERDFYNRMVKLYQQQNNSQCPASLAEIFPLVKAHLHEALDSRKPARPLELRFSPARVPLDTSSEPTPYRLDPQTCKVKLDPQSLIPIRWDPKE